MSTTKIMVFCRFCAEQKPYADVKVLQEDRVSVIEKLSLFGVVFVDFSNKMLPETVCCACSEHINVSYEFYLKVKRSQVVLSKICGVEVETEICLQDNKLAGYVAVKEESYDDGEYLRDELLSSSEDTAVNAQSLAKKDDLEGHTYPISAVKEERYYHGDVFTKGSRGWGSYPWQCGECGARDAGAGLAALRAHCRSDHRICFAAKCADCDERLDGFHQFVVHARGHRKALRNYCELCDIKMEELTHPDCHSRDQSCSLCGDTFHNQASLRSHLKLYAAKSLTLDLTGPDDASDVRNWAEYPTICRFCKLKVVDKDVLTAHCMEVHRRCFGSQCVDCDESVDCFKDFVEHVKRHRPYLKKICPYCNTDMRDEDDAHVASHAARRHACPACARSFPRQRALRAHAARLHPSPLIAPPKKRRKGPPTDKELTCQVCGVIMKTPASLKAHLRTHTVRKRNYTCDRCGKAYYTKGSLDAHRKIHDGQATEACKMCHKTFLTLQRLKKHVKTHNLQMPFECDCCQRRFSSKDRLREHVKVHMDVLPFQCQHCAKRFRHKGILRTHEHQHTGARPYSCNVCCMDFGNWSNCNKHMKRKHGTTLAKHVMTPHGKLALDPATGRPGRLRMDRGVREWSERMLMPRVKGARDHAERESF